VPFHEAVRASCPLCSQTGENITDWALEQFRGRYHDPSISKWDIFHYIYAVLQHPEYRERYAANRSALEWVIDQYQVSTDKRSGITNEANRDDDPQYILRLVCQVITISLETVRIVNELPALGVVETSGG
jgi:predicted helicase